MKAIIPCAGKGERMQDYTKNTSKSILKVGDKPLVLHSIDALKKYGINEIIVVTGYCSDKIEKTIGNKATFVYNPLYAITGILVSVAAAKHLIPKEEGMLILPGDLFFDEKILRKIMESKGDIVVAVKEKRCDEEDAKVKILGGKAIYFSKKMPIGEATGEFIGIAKFSAKGKDYFLKEADSLLKEGKTQSYIMDIFNILIEKKTIEIVLVYVGDLFAVEVDFKKDLMKVKEFISKR